MVFIHMFNDDPEYHGDLVLKLSVVGGSRL